MPDETAPEHGADIGSVRVTIATASGPGRPPPARRVRMPVLAMIVMVGALAVAAVVAPGGGRREQARNVARPVPSAGAFGLGVACPRLVVFASRDGFARVDVDRFRPCGTYGNYVTIVFRRVGGTWIRALEMSAWTCRSRPLPRPVLTELGLCLRGQEHRRSL